MAKFVGSRTPKQCKTHHEKIIGKKNIATVKVIPRLRDFYKDHYRLRYLDLEHCLKEF